MMPLHILGGILAILTAGILIGIAIHRYWPRSAPQKEPEEDNEIYIENLMQIGDVIQFTVNGELYATKLDYVDKRMVYRTGEVYHVRTGYQLDVDIANRAYHMWSIRRSMNLAPKKKLPYKVTSVDNFHGMDGLGYMYDPKEVDEVMTELLQCRVDSD